MQHTISNNQMHTIQFQVNKKTLKYPYATLKKQIHNIHIKTYVIYIHSNLHYKIFTIKIQENKHTITISNHIQIFTHTHMQISNK